MGVNVFRIQRTDGASPGGYYPSSSSYKDVLGNRILLSGYVDIYVSEVTPRINDISLNISIPKTDYGSVTENLDVGISKAEYFIDFKGYIQESTPSGTRTKADLLWNIAEYNNPKCIFVKYRNKWLMGADPSVSSTGGHFKFYKLSFLDSIKSDPTEESTYYPKRMYVSGSLRKVDKD